MIFRLLVVDIDGTLIGKEPNISSANKSAIRDAIAKGITVSLCTGRSIQGAMPMIDELSLDCPHIFYNGSLVANSVQGTEVFCQPIDADVLLAALHFARSNNLSLELYSPAEYYVERVTPAIQMHADFLKTRPVVTDLAEVARDKTIIKAGMLAISQEEKRKAREFANAFAGKLRFEYAPSPSLPDVDFINIVHPAVSKGRALGILARFLSIPLAEVAAIGDGPNDVELLIGASLGIAVANAVPETKAVARYITDSADDDGVAKAIYRWVISPAGA